MIKQRILCPHHEELTPSCVVYDDGSYHCYGCGASGKAANIGLEVEQEEQRKPGYVEDIQKTLDNIARMPVVGIRGFSLPTDGEFYYIVYPSGTYYKKRAIRSEERPGQKYLSPSGHEKQLFKAVDKPEHRNLCIVEGELNAMSLAIVGLPMNIVSPGGAGDFYSKELPKYLTHYLKHHTLYLMVDKDAAGTLAAIELKARLMQYKNKDDIRICLIEKDFNEILTDGENGREKLEMEVRKWL